MTITEQLEAIIPDIESNQKDNTGKGSVRDLALYLIEERERALRTPSDLSSFYDKMECELFFMNEKYGKINVEVKVLRYGDMP